MRHYKPQDIAEPDKAQRVLYMTPTMCSYHTQLADTGGILFRILFPVSGVISKVVIGVGTMTGAPELIISSERVNGDKFAYSFKTKAGVQQVPDMFDVEALDRAMISVAEGTLTDVWISFMFMPEGEKVKVREDV